MSEVAPDKANMALKILYTLHGIDSQRYVVKPSKLFEVVVFREIGLGTVDIKQCLEAIREASPDFASICDTHDDEFAVYSADYAEDGLPLQSHGRVSQSSMIDATGKLGSSKLMKEQLELLIHLLPVRKPKELIADFLNSQKLKSEGSDLLMSSDAAKAPLHPFPYPPQSLMNPTLLHSLPSLPPPVQIPASLTADFQKPSLRSDPCLPSSPPIRARPSKTVADSDAAGGSSAPAGTSSTGAAPGPAKRAYAESSMTKRRKASSPKAEGESQCSNCGVATASTWRRIESSDGKKDLLCNACGLYYKSKHVMRPSFLWDKMRTRGEVDAAAATPAANAPPPLAPSAKGPGLAKAPRAPQPPLYAGGRPSVLDEPAAAPHPTMLWSQGGSHMLPSDMVDLSDRLVDKPKSKYTVIPPSDAINDNKENELRLPSVTPAQVQLKHPAGFGPGPRYASEQPARPAPREDDGYPMPEPPRTPERRSTMDHQPLDSIQKLFDITTPDQRTNLMMPGSGSASKWLRRVMNPASFEDFLRTPTPRKTRTNDLSILTSSPPTSSNLFSEISDWTMYETASPSHPSSPRPMKLFKDDKTAEVGKS